MTLKKVFKIIGSIVSWIIPIYGIFIGIVIGVGLILIIISIILEILK